MKKLLVSGLVAQLFFRFGHWRMHHYEGLPKKNQSLADKFAMLTMGSDCQWKTNPWKINLQL